MQLLFDLVENIVVAIIRAGEDVGPSLRANKLCEAQVGGIEDEDAEQGDEEDSRPARKGGFCPLAAGRLYRGYCRYSYLRRWHGSWQFDGRYGCQREILFLPCVLCRAQTASLLRWRGRGHRWRLYGVRCCGL